MKKVIFTLTAVLLALVVLVGCNSEQSEPASAHTHGYVLQGDGTLKCSGCSSVIKDPYWAELSSDGRIVGQPHIISGEFYEFTESTGSSRAVSGRNIVIYTKDNMNLTVNSANDNVTHFGNANKVTVKNNESFHARAKTSHLDIQKGSVFFESEIAADTAVKICPDVENTNINVNVNHGIILPNLYIEISVKFSVQIGGQGIVKEINAEATTGSPSDVKVKISAESSVKIEKVGCDKAEHIDDGSDPVVKEKIHEHTFDTSKWVMIDSEYHGHKCTGTDCEYVSESDKEQHSWGDVTNGKITCTACGYEIDFPLTNELLDVMFSRAKTVYGEVEKAIEGYIKGSINLDNLTFTKNNGTAKYKASQNGKGSRSWGDWDPVTGSKETTCEVELSGIEGEFKVIDKLPVFEFTFKIEKCSFTGADATAWESEIGSVEGQSGKLVGSSMADRSYIEVNGKKYDEGNGYSSGRVFFGAINNALLTSGTISFSDFAAEVTNSNGDKDQLTVSGSVSINILPDDDRCIVKALTDCKIENTCIVGGKTCVAVFELSNGLECNSRSNGGFKGGKVKMSIRYNNTDEVSAEVDLSNGISAIDGGAVSEGVGFNLKIKLDPNTIDYSCPEIRFDIKHGTKINTYEDLKNNFTFTDQSAHVNGQSVPPSAVVKVIFDFIKDKIDNPQV